MVGDIYDSIRKEFVKALPEEIVRQRLIRHMIDSLGYPYELIAVEKSLRQMPHMLLTDEDIPDRRADIICFVKGIQQGFDLYPLLMIECKSVKLTDKVISQVVGYNYYVNACFVAIANQDAIRLGWYDPITKRYIFVDGLPRYDELVASLT